jgi:hypothetical protein
MTIRTRGFLTFLASAIAGVAGYWLLFHFLSGAQASVRLPAYPLALPIVGVIIGLLEWITGLPIRKIDEGWQRFPMYVQVPVGLIGAVVVIWTFVWIVVMSVGA